VSVTAKPENRNLATRSVVISVKDTGEGMAKEEIEHLFESFSRGKAGSKMWTEGAGLGLYIAKQFVSMHKGRIKAESPGKGKGSTFTVELPVQ
ncbi:MAG: ATP-binding protein, partial [Candidatus Pacearchaeota archaeon]|nr:ATP-binding protein [Candidatus Pacearchaeota archaeon]